MRVTRAYEMQIPSYKATLHEWWPWHDQRGHDDRAHSGAGVFPLQSVLAGDGAVAFRSKGDARLPVVMTGVPAPWGFREPDLPDEVRLLVEAYNLTRNGVAGQDW